MKPSFSSRSMRRQQGDGESPTRSEICAVDSDASSWSNARMRFSYLSRASDG
jgi:hypothetical protein